MNGNAEEMPYEKANAERKNYKKSKFNHTTLAMSNSSIYFIILTEILAKEPFHIRIRIS